MISSAPGQDRRQHERNRDLARDREQVGAGDARRFLERRVHPFECAGYLDEDEGEQIHRLDEDDAGVAVDVEDRAVEAEHVHEEAV